MDSKDNMNGDTSLMGIENKGAESSKDKADRIYIFSQDTDRPGIMFYEVNPEEYGFEGNVGEGYFLVDPSTADTEVVWDDKINLPNGTQYRKASDGTDYTITTLIMSEVDFRLKKDMILHGKENGIPLVPINAKDIQPAIDKTNNIERIGSNKIVVHDSEKFSVPEEPSIE